MPYAPTADERTKAERILTRLIPGRRAYERYRAQVARYLGAHDLVLPRVSHQGVVGNVTSLRMRHSELFEREYLVAYADPDWLACVAPNCDAIAAPLLSEKTGADLPPLVFVPEPRARSRSLRFRSILEHEFVHVNQAILGRLSAPTGELERDFLRGAHVEYEANLVQLVRWTDLYPRRIRDASVSLEHWCLVRGYSQALEQTLFDAAAHRVASKRLVAFLDELPRLIRALVRRTHVDARLVSWFVARQTSHAATACAIVGGASPEWARSRAANDVRRWLMDRTEGA